jgi:hypothetical protein
MKKILGVILLLSTQIIFPLQAFAQEVATQEAQMQASASATETKPEAAAEKPTDQANPFLEKSDTSVKSESVSTSALKSLAQSLTSAGSAPLRQRVIVEKLARKMFKGTDAIELTVDNVTSDEVKVELVDAKGQKTTPQTVMSTDGLVTTVRINPPHAFRPGKYTLRVTDYTGQTSEQDFTWGVLAINSDKSVYEPNDTAALSFAVLDEKGGVVCDAIVTLLVTMPSGNKVTLSTDTGSITVHKDVCTSHDVTETPDYSAVYKPETVGTYTLELTAKTKNGTYTITDGFTVQQHVQFTISRASATRIYPYNTYPMTMHITADKDFTGVVSEVVPSSFTVTAQEGSAPFVSTQGVLGESTNADVPELQMPFHGKHAISQGFGASLTDPLEKDLYKQFGLAGHDGIDFDMPIGTQIYAVDAGKVVLAGDGAYGKTLVIQHTWGRSYYGHLSEITVKDGDTVAMGDTVALSGNTGISTDPHLHFSLKLNGADMQNGYFGKTNPGQYLPITMTQADTKDVLGASISDDQGFKKLSWKVSMKKGESISLGYLYKAPEVSPQFYTTGPLTVSTTRGEKVYAESRQWQIAADALDGQMQLYFHKENADLNTTYNALSLTPPETGTDTASTVASTTNVNLSPPTALCESSDNTGNTFNKVSAASATNGTNERCLASFISMPVGTASNGSAFTITTTDTAAIAANIWVVNSSATTTTTNTSIYLYKYDGATLTRFKTLAQTSSPGTTVTQVSYAAAAPDATVSFAATDRIVAIVSRTVTNRVAGSSISVLFDSTARTAASLTLKYTPLTNNHPTLSGAKEDDFTTAAATTNCATAGTTYNTKWTCVTNSSSSTTLGTVSADTSGGANTSSWAILTSKASTTLGTNFGTPNAFPGNTYMYQTGIPSTDVGATLTTAINTTSNATAGTTPFYHGGLFIRNASTYIILCVGYDGTNRGVWINNNGVMSNSTAISNNSLIWVRWTNTATGFQASYSTDGSTFTNLGSTINVAVDGTTNTKFGLTAYTGAISTQYSAAFEYFSYQSALYTQSASLISQNVDSSEPTAVVHDLGVANHALHVVAIDSQGGYMYAAGADQVPGNYEARIEKRRLSDGSLVTAFGTNGAIQENPSSGIDAFYAIAIDTTRGYMYLAGEDAVNTNMQWRIEKRNLSDGALVGGFGASGIIQENPGANDDEITSMVLDASGGYLYVGGRDRTSGDEWRLEKRAVLDGSLVSGFGTLGVATSNNTGAGGHTISSLALDTTNGYIYSGGYGFNGTSDEWRLEKRNTTDGQLVSGFGTSGTLVEDATTGHDQLYSIDLDIAGGFIYLAGRDDAGSSDYEWRLEKRNVSDGSVVTAFGTLGIVKENPSVNDDEIWQIKVDTSNNAFYTVGFDKSPSNVNAEWRIEKRDTTAGSLISGFGSGGVIATDYATLGDDIVRNIAIDPASNYLYVVGYDTLPGLYTELRAEKRTMNDGLLAWGSALAAQDTGVTVSSGEAFRLQQLLKVTGANASASGQLFSLQYVDKGTGSCAAPAGGTPSVYTNVTTGTLIAFNNNQTPADGSTLYTSTGVTNGADTIRPQTYEELNDFTNSTSAIAVNEDGRWDFSLVNSGGAVGATYCFRVVKTGGTVLSAYTTYAQVTVGPTLDLLMRHGKWFITGALQKFSF